MLYTIFLLLAGFAMSPPSSPTVPESPRSRRVIAKVKPRLKTQCAAKNLKLGAPVFMRIFKQEHLLEVWLRSGSRYVLFKTYPIAKFSGHLGPKLKEGDRQAPEGFYYVTPARLNPRSSYHLAFNVGYPNRYDRALKRTGSAIMVHGSNLSIGCFAMTDPRIEEIYTVAHEAFVSGQRFFRIHIFPFRMTDKAMRAHGTSAHYPFWQNLKEGYDLFEKNRVDPNVEVRGGRYVFD